MVRNFPHMSERFASSWKVHLSATCAAWSILPENVSRYKLVGVRNMGSQCFVAEELARAVAERSCSIEFRQLRSACFRLTSLNLM